MAYARIVTIGNGTVIRNMDMALHPTWKVDQVATALASVICGEEHILKVEVNYDGCDDSKTV